MWHFSLESSMFRFVSLMGLVVLTVAAAKLSASAKNASKPSLPNGPQTDSLPRAAAVPTLTQPTFHARFSLN